MEVHYRMKHLPQIIGSPASTIYYWISIGKFPKGRKTGPNTRIWSESELKEWLLSRKEA